MENKNLKKEEIKTCQDNIKKCCEKIFTLKLAIKGLVGYLPEYITDKMVEIAGEISSELNSLKYYERQLKSLEGKDE